MQSKAFSSVFMFEQIECEQMSLMMMFFWAAIKESKDSRKINLTTQKELKQLERSLWEIKHIKFVFQKLFPSKISPRSQ